MSYESSICDEIDAACAAVRAKDDAGIAEELKKLRAKVNDSTGFMDEYVLKEALDEAIRRLFGERRAGDRQQAPGDALLRQPRQAQGHGLPEVYPG